MVRGGICAHVHDPYKIAGCSVCALQQRGKTPWKRSSGSTWKNVFLPPIRGRAASSALPSAPFLSMIQSVITLISSAHVLNVTILCARAESSAVLGYYMLQGLASFASKLT